MPAPPRIALRERRPAGLADDAVPFVNDDPVLADELEDRHAGDPAA